MRLKKRDGQALAVEDLSDAAPVALIEPPARQHAMLAMAAAGADEAARPAQPDQRRAALLLGAEGLPKRLVAQTTHARCNLEPHNRDPLMQNILRTYIPSGGVSRISRNKYGQGGAMAVHMVRNDEIWSVIVIWTGLVRQLNQTDHPEHKLALQTFVHELVHVDDLRLFTRTYPGGWRAAKPRMGEIINRAPVRAPPRERRG